MLQTELSSLHREGKSGQRRAAHRLTAGYIGNSVTASATENDRLPTVTGR